ncbi:hypothetical protein FACS189454_02270 [Planctomycetales bacterium]|nr:hypothetical protein FACS189454_02270 [Planctomycetales bacterium]
MKSKVHTLLAVFAAVSLCVSAALRAADPDYKGPNALAVSSDGKTLYVADTDSCEISVIDTAANKVIKTFKTNGVAPLSVVLCKENKVLYVVGGGYKGKFLKLDADDGKILNSVDSGHTPRGIAVSPDGTKAFVSCRFSNDVWEYVLPEMKFIQRFNVIREPHSAVVTKDGKYVLVCNSIPLDVGNKPEDPDALIDVAAEISVIGVADGKTKQIRLPNGSGSLHGIALSPDGKYVYVSEVLARFQIPTTQVERGWMNTAGMAIIDTAKIEGKNNGFVNAVLLDDVDLGAANPSGIATSADGNTIYIATAGTSELIVINAKTMHAKLAELPEYEMGAEASYGNKTGTANDVPNDLSFLVGMKKRVSLDGKGARAVAVSGDNVYVGMYFSDTVVKVDTKSNAKTVIPVGARELGPADLDAVRRGQMWWNDATLCFQKWQSCASCHPDARMDGYNWDLLNDDLGNPKNAKSLLYSPFTTPSMWQAVRDNPELDKKLKRKVWNSEEQGLQCITTGFQFIQFVMPDPEKCKDIDLFLRAEKAVPSPYLADGKLSAKAERGKKVFEDDKVGCAKCHLPNRYYTDQKSHDVNTKCYFDRTNEFDTPTLHEIWRTAPYMHDGRYKTVYDVIKIGQHGDGEYGDVAGLSDEQIDALVEYVLSL